MLFLDPNFCYAYKVSDFEIRMVHRVGVGLWAVKVKDMT